MAGLTDLEYTQEEVELGRAMQYAKEQLGANTLAWSEVLVVMKCLGYRKVEEAVPYVLPRKRRAGYCRPKADPGGASGPPAGGA